MVVVGPGVVVVVVGAAVVEVVVGAAVVVVGALVVVVGGGAVVGGTHCPLLHSSPFRQPPQSSVPPQPSLTESHWPGGQVVVGVQHAPCVESRQT